MVYLRSLLGISLLFGGVIQAESCENAPARIVYPQPSSIPNGPALNGSDFIGTPASGTPLKPRFKFRPEASLMHTDGGNSGARDDTGPLGINPNVTSATTPFNMILWGADGAMICGYANTSAGSSPRIGIAIADPTTFQVLATWYPPGNESLNLAYMELIQETNEVVINSKEGNIYIIHHNCCDGNHHFTTSRTITLANSFQPGQQLLNSMYDMAGNIWFTTGGLINGGDAAETSLTYGYVTPAGEIIKELVQDQMVENGIAISGLDVFMVTGPTAALNASNDIGYIWSMSSDRRGGIKINWKTPYAGKAGTDSSPPQGAGSSPALLTDQYVAITDRASPQISLNVFRQKPQESNETQRVCKVPLFEPGASNNDNAVLAHFDGETNGLMVQNNWNIPPLFQPQPGAPVDIDGPWNNMSKMPGDMWRVDVDADGNCSVRWKIPHLAVKSVSVLSTKAGLIYSYVQDMERSPQGDYIWYVTGVDWKTGNSIFKKKTGTGGKFNDNWLQSSIGPDGTFYQTVFGGIVAVKDEK